ncbi:MAG TPA: maleylpyruvate isomerase N-terminal domain-containing protein [Trebonia sp.]|nr:maleylpyruvate isomerase N-terminal domain-containing protein [Trebonia sp.]
MAGNASLLAQAVDQADAVISAIPAGKADAPTPCTDFDVTQLIRHVAVIAGRVSAAIAPASAQPGTDWEHAPTQLRRLLDGADAAGPGMRSLVSWPLSPSVNSIAAPPMKTSATTTGESLSACAEPSCRYPAGREQHVADRHDVADGQFPGSPPALRNRRPAKAFGCSCSDLVMCVTSGLA